MIRQKIHIDSCDWTAYIYYVVTKFHMDEIIDRLESIGCKGEHLQSAYDNLSSGRCDTGLTYSNRNRRETVIVIAKTTSPLEFIQSWTHEVSHMVDHIAVSFGIDPHGESIRYLQDDIIAETYNVAKQFLCKCFRKNKHDV